MNRFQSNQIDNYNDRRKEARLQLDSKRPKWYVDAKEKFDNEKDYETKKRYEIELSDKIKKYLDENV